MVSNRILQECLEDYAEVMRLSMALYDRNRTCVAGEEEEPPETEIFERFQDSAADMQALGSRCLFKVGAEETGYVLSVNGASKDVYPMGQLAVRQLERILEMSYSRDDRNQFFHNLLLDNLAKQMHLGADSWWAVLMVKGTACEAYDIQAVLKNILANRTGDFVIPMEECSVAVIRRLEDWEGKKEIEELAHILSDTVSAETLCRICTSCGTVAFSLREVSRSYKVRLP